MRRGVALDDDDDPDPDDDGSESHPPLGAPVPEHAPPGAAMPSMLRFDCRNKSYAESEAER
jgi:hypothetical protein